MFMCVCYLQRRRLGHVSILEVTNPPWPQAALGYLGNDDGRCSMATVKVCIPKLRVTKSGRVVKTGTITRHVHVRVRRK